MPKSDWICTQCYEIDRPIRLQKGGTWPFFILLYIAVGLVVFPLTLVWLAFMFFIGFITKGIIFKGAPMPIFPLIQYLPSAPYIVKLCKHCGSVSKMVKLTSQEGIDAFEWHQKTFFFEDEKG